MVAKKHESQKLTYLVELAGQQARLREAILYVSTRSIAMDRFGLTKLNKILWRADFTAFLERHVPVTGRPYQRLERGPAPIEMPILLAEMQQSFQLTILQINLGTNADGKPMIEKRPIAERAPIMRWFSEDDLRFLDRAIEHYRHMSGTEASDDSHGAAWKTREDADPMPYEAAYLSDKELGSEQLARAREIALERGWKSK